MAQYVSLTAFTRERVSKHLSCANEPTYAVDTPIRPPKRRRLSSSSPESTAQLEASSSSEVAANGNRVSCPVCNNKTVPASLINEHIDSGCKYMGIEKVTNRNQWANMLSGANRSPANSKSKAKGKLKVLPQFSFKTILRV